MKSQVPVFAIDMLSPCLAEKLLYSGSHSLGQSSIDKRNVWYPAVGASVELSVGSLSP